MLFTAEWSTDVIHLICSFMLVYRSHKHLREIILVELGAAGSGDSGGGRPPPSTPPRRTSGVPPTVFEYLAVSPARRASLGGGGGASQPRAPPPPPPDAAGHARRGFFLLRVWALLGLAHCAASVGVAYARELRALFALLGAAPPEAAVGFLEPLWAGLATPLLGSAIPTLLRDAATGAAWAASVALPAAARGTASLSGVALPLLLPLLPVAELRALVARTDAALAQLPKGGGAAAEAPE
jgi:hypothetical protein